MTGQPDITAELVAAAQAYDHDHRNDGYNRPEWWTRVPDEQVARLLTGALPALTTATPADDEEDGYEPFIAASTSTRGSPGSPIRYVPESRVAEAAAQAATTERESIRQLAIERKAVYVVWHKDIKRYRQYPFADLLGGTGGDHA